MAQASAAPVATTAKPLSKEAVFILRTHCLRPKGQKLNKAAQSGE
jgi:hypothetical protein